MIDLGSAHDGDGARLCTVGDLASRRSAVEKLRHRTYVSTYPQTVRGQAHVRLAQFILNNNVFFTCNVILAICE